MITEKMYLMAKEVVAEYEQQLNKADVMGSKNLQLKPIATKEIGKQYYWRRLYWKPEFSGEVIIKGEGGSHRVKGWQVEYVDKSKRELANKHCGLPPETYCTGFANDEDLFESTVERKSCVE